MSEETFGAIVTWSLLPGAGSGLLDTWTAAGLPAEFVPAISYDDVFRKAADSLSEKDKHLFARPAWREDVPEAEAAALSSGIRGSRAWGILLDSIGRPSEWFVCVDGMGGSALPVLKCVVEIDGRLRLFDKTNAHESTDKKVAAWLRAEYERLKARARAEAMTGVAIRFVTVVAHAAALGDAIYFVPAKYLDEWRKAAHAIALAGEHKFYEIPLARSGPAEEAVADAVVRQCEATMGRIEADIASPRKSANDLRARTHMSTEIEETLNIYVDLFAHRPDVQERLDMLRARLAAAMLTAENEDAAAER